MPAEVEETSDDERDPPRALTMEDMEDEPDAIKEHRAKALAERARVLSDAEKDEVWDLMRGQIPMIYVYETRTDRNIRVFRLSRIEG